MLPTQFSHFRIHETLPASSGSQSGAQGSPSTLPRSSSQEIPRFQGSFSWRGFLTWKAPTLTNSTQTRFRSWMIRLSTSLTSIFTRVAAKDTNFKLVWDLVTTNSQLIFQMKTTGNYFWGSEDHFTIHKSRTRCHCYQWMPMSLCLSNLFLESSIFIIINFPAI